MNTAKIILVSIRSFYFLFHLNEEKCLDANFRISINGKICTNKMTGRRKEMWCRSYKFLLAIW